MPDNQLVPYQEHLPAVICGVYREPDRMELLEWLGEWPKLTNAMVEAQFLICHDAVWETRYQTHGKIEYQWRRVHYFTEQLVAVSLTANRGRQEKYQLKHLTLFERVGKTCFFAPRPWLNPQGKLVITLHQLRFA